MQLCRLLSYCLGLTAFLWDVVRIYIEGKDLSGPLQSYLLYQHLRNDLGMKVSCRVPAHIVCNGKRVCNGPWPGLDAGKPEFKVMGVRAGLYVSVYPVQIFLKKEPCLAVQHFCMLFSIPIKADGPHPDVNWLSFLSSQL